MPFSQNEILMNGIIKAQNKLYNRAPSFLCTIQTAESTCEVRSDPTKKLTPENFDESHIICVNL